MTFANTDAAAATMDSPYDCRDAVYRATAHMIFLRNQGMTMDGLAGELGVTRLELERFVRHLDDVGFAQRAIRIFGI